MGMTPVVKMNKMRAKGVIKTVTKDQIKHEDYRTSLFEKQQFKHTGTKIMQRKHQLYTADITKVTLSPFNDKRWITREGNKCIPSGDQVCEGNMLSDLTDEEMEQLFIEF